VLNTPKVVKCGNGAVYVIIIGYYSPSVNDSYGLLL